MSKLELPSDRLPLFVSAGVIKSEEEIAQFTESDQLAIQIIGSISENENKPPDIGVDFHFDKSTGIAENARRLINPGSKVAERYLSRSIDLIHSAGQIAIVAITSLSGENPKAVLPRLALFAQESGADGIEINGSCPNQSGDLLCCDTEQTLRVCHAVREAVGNDFYILYKPADLGETKIRRYKQSSFIDVVDGVAAINALKRPPLINPRTGKPFLGVESTGYVGQSGAAITSVARRNLRSWLRPLSGSAEFPITDSPIDVWSVGGIFNGYEAYDREVNIGAFAVGGAQEFYRAENPIEVISRWSEEYSLVHQGVASGSS